MPILKKVKWEHFAHQIAKAVKPDVAYIAAGYSKNGADQGAGKLLKKAEIQARIAEIRANVISVATEKAGIDKAWVMSELVDIVRRGKAVELVIGKEGEKAEVRQNLAAANKALELIGKELAMFIDRKEIRTGPLDTLDHDDLKKLNDAIQQIYGAGTEFVAAGAGRTRH